MHSLLRAVSVAAVLGTAAQGWCAVVYVNDAAGYNAAVSSLSVVGTEDFESLFPTGGSGTDLPGLNGTVINADLGLVVTASSATIMGVGSGWGQDADSNSFWDSNYGALTVELALPSSQPVLGVSLNVLSWYNDINGAVGTPDVKVYDPSGHLIGSGTVAGSTMASASGYLGIAAGPGESIGTIVLTPTTDYTVGLDNLVVVPEPMAYPIVAGVGLLGAALVRRGRRNCQPV